MASEAIHSYDRYGRGLRQSGPATGEIRGPIFARKERVIIWRNRGIGEDCIVLISDPEGY